MDNQTDCKEIMASRLQEALDDKKMRASDLARSTSLSRATISQYITKLYPIPARAAQLMANVLEVNPKWLMGKSDDKFAKEVTWVDHNKSWHFDNIGGISNWAQDDLEHQKRQTDRIETYAAKMWLSKDDSELLELWHKASLKQKMIAYKILTEEET